MNACGTWVVLWIIKGNYTDSFVDHIQMSEKSAKWLRKWCQKYTEHANKSWNWYMLWTIQRSKYIVIYYDHHWLFKNKWKCVTFFLYVIDRSEFQNLKCSLLVNNDINPSTMGIQTIWEVIPMKFKPIAIVIPLFCQRGESWNCWCPSVWPLVSQSVSHSVCPSKLRSQIWLDGSVWISSMSFPVMWGWCTLMENAWLLLKYES